MSIISTLGFLVAILRLRSRENTIRNLQEFPLLNPNFVFQLTSYKTSAFSNPAALAFFGKDFTWNLIDTNMCAELFSTIVENAEHRQQEIHYKGLSFLINYVGSRKQQVINVYGTDITELNKLKEDSFQKNKLAAVGLLAAGVGHEINNPLAIAQGALFGIKKNWIDRKEPKYAKYIEMQENAFLRIKNIVDGLRTFAHEDITNSGSIFDVHQAIKETYNLVSDIYKLNRVRIKLDFNAKCSTILGSFGKLQQVMMNLLSNANDALKTFEEKEVEIRTYNSNENIIIEFSDNGEGIDPEIQDKIFDAFYTTKKIGEGTGLGLGICKQIIFDMKGSIELDSHTKEGTKFIITIPNAQDQVNDSSVKKSTFEKKNIDEAILLVDDEPILLELIKEQLMDYDLKIFTASSGPEALKVIDSHLDQINFVLTDLTMPGMSGAEWVLMAKEKYECSHIKFFVLSGAIHAENLDEFDFKFQKPIEIEDVIKIMLEFKSNKK